MAASLEPVVERAGRFFAVGEFQNRLNMLTQRISMSAVRGYSSLSIMFLSRHRHQLPSLRLHPRRHEGREVQPRVPVEHQLVFDELVGDVGRQLALRQLVPWDPGFDVRAAKIVVAPA